MTTIEKYNREIIGILYDGTIYSGKSALEMARLALNEKNGFRMVNRAEAIMMHACDLGMNWTNLSKAPVLFYWDSEKGPTSDHDCLVSCYLKDEMSGNSG